MKKIMMLISILIVTGMVIGIGLEIVNYLEEMKPLCLEYLEKEYCDKTELECAIACKNFDKEYLRLETTSRFFGSTTYDCWCLNNGSTIQIW